jgi:hypothetical protein
MLLIDCYYKKVRVFCKTKDILSQSRKERKEKRQKVGVVVKGKEKTKGRKPQRAHPPNSTSGRENNQYYKKVIYFLL